MQPDGVGIRQPVWRPFQGEQFEQNPAIDFVFPFENRYAPGEIHRNGYALEAEYLGKLHEERGDLANDKLIVVFLPAEGDKGKHQSEPQVAQRLLAQKFLQRWINFDIRQRIRAMQHAVVAPDAGKLGGRRRGRCVQSLDARE